MRTRLGALVLCLMIPLTACSSTDPAGGGTGASKSKDAVALDLADYQEAMMPIGEREEVIIEKQNSVLGENYTDDETTYQVLSEVVPEYTQLVEDLEAVQPATPEVQAVHEVYLKGANLQQAGMARTLSALENADTALVADANRELSEGRSLLREWQGKVKALAAEHPAA